MAGISFKAPLPPAPRGFGGGRGPAGPGGATPAAAPPQPPRRSAIQAVFAYKCAKAACEAKDWRPAHPFGTTGAQASETSRNTLQMDITELKPWAQVPQLKDASGVATYTATVDMPASWKPGSQAAISLGEVMDSFALSINGKGVPINQISAAAEVGRYLRPGRNTVRIRVATTLNNRLSQLDPDVAKRNFIQNYGLIGPTQIIPHN